MKKCSALILVFTLVLAMLAGCGADGGTPQSGAQSQPVSASDNTAQTSVPQGQTFDEPELNITEVYGLGPNGETAGSSLDLTFTEDELAQLKDGGFKVGVSMHMLNNASNTIKIDVMKGILAERGVEVVATTDAQLDPAKMVSDMESIMVMEPDVIVSCVADPISNKSIFEQARDAGRVTKRSIKRAFSEEQKSFVRRKVIGLRENRSDFIERQKGHGRGRETGSEKRPDTLVLSLDRCF